ncbi:MAG: TfoX/Sxy family DNA transformation protein [Rhodobacteraceae bacterium]|nr:TfoX/Sxy family DNA transformation protein [Paracoccaceae bacterium]
MAAAFARAGIETAQEIRQLGAEAAYARLLAAGTRPHFMAFQALVLGLQDRPFTDADPAGKTALRARFEALKAAQGPTSPIDDALAEIGWWQPRGARATPASALWAATSPAGRRSGRRDPQSH